LRRAFPARAMEPLGAFDARAFAITRRAAAFVAEKADRLVVEAAQAIGKTPRLAAIAFGSRAFGVGLAWHERSAARAALPSAARAGGRRRGQARGDHGARVFRGDFGPVDVGDDLAGAEESECAA